MISRDYVTASYIERVLFNNMLDQLPNFGKVMRKYVCQYNFTKKTFILKVLKHVSYLKDLTLGQINQVYYNLKPRFIEKGTVILKPYDEIESLIIIVNGVVEMTTEFDGNEFVL